LPSPHCDKALCLSVSAAYKALLSSLCSFVFRDGRRTIAKPKRGAQGGQQNNFQNKFCIAFTPRKLVNISTAFQPTAPQRLIRHMIPPSFPGAGSAENIGTAKRFITFIKPRSFAAPTAFHNHQFVRNINSTLRTRLSCVLDAFK
jgi:hypothetical protein